MAAIPVHLMLISSLVLAVVLLGVVFIILKYRRKQRLRQEELDMMAMFYAPYVMTESTPWHLSKTACVTIQPRIYEDLHRSEDAGNTQEGTLATVSGENVAGKLEFSLQFDSHRSILLVNLHKAHGLRDEEQVDVTYYVTINILPQIHRSFQSTAVKGQNPEFHELFEVCVPYESLLEQQIKFTVSHFDCVAHHEFVGHVMVHLAELEHGGLNLSREILLVRNIDAVAKTNGELGELLFAVAFRPLTGMINVDVLRARDLSLGKDGQKPDPYVKVLLIRAGHEFWTKTATLQNTRGPTYNEKLVFHVGMAALHNINLQLCVMHDGQGGCEDKCLGQVFLGPESTGSQFEQWNDMRVGNKPIIARWHKLFQ